MIVDLAVLGYMTALITIITALWRAFDSIARMREKVGDSIQELNHQIEKLRISEQSDREWAELSIRGTIEKLEHFSTRTRGELKELDTRMDDVEGFLQKTTAFERRH
jgi:prefoldin subunit 5